MIQFTLSQAWAVILSVCGGIVTISAAVSVAIKIRNHFKKPNDLQNEEIARLKRDVDEIRDDLRQTKVEFLTFFKKDKQRLDAIEQGNHITQKALLALLSHGIDGNDIEPLKSARKELHDYLILK